MELDQIKELMASVENSKIKRISLKKGDFELQIEKEDSHPPIHTVVSAGHSPRSMFAGEGVSSESVFHVEHPHSKAEKKNPRGTEAISEGTFVTSPMVGTFYIYPAPDQPAFVKVGDTVDENTVVCIIEAMKVMNEVKANVRGTIAEILVDNAHPVEFGTKIFRVV